MHANWIVRYKASDWDVKCNECELFFLHDDDDVRTLLYDNDDDVITLLYDTDVITLVVVIWRGTRFLVNPL